MCQEKLSIKDTFQTAKNDLMVDKKPTVFLFHWNCVNIFLYAGKIIGPLLLAS